MRAPFEELVYCNKTHSYQAIRFIKNKKYIRKVFKLIGIYWITIYSVDNILLASFWDGSEYYINRDDYFLTEKQSRLKKLKELNENWG